MSKVESIKKELNDRIQNSQVVITPADVESLGLLLEEKTYFDASKRAGVSESAIKQTMSRLLFQHDYTVTPLYKAMEHWKAERVRFKKSKR